MSADPTAATDTPDEANSYDGIPFDADHAPEPPKTRSWKVVLWLLATVIVLCLAGAGGAFWAITGGAKALADPARRATGGYLNDLETGSYNDAYLSLCDTVMKQLTREQFVSQMQGESKIKSYVVRDVSVRTVDNVDTATATVDITREGGAVEHRLILLNSQDGTWLICSQPF